MLGSDYIIEDKHEEIQNSKTRELFNEVKNTYNTGCYRSSVVILWSVVICDIIYKLNDLKDIYGDTAAEKLLEEINEKRQQNEKDSSWELELVKETKERTKLLDLKTFNSLNYLRQNRHISAHPSLDDDDKLHAPTKETVRALIRDVLTGLLTKPALYGNKAFVSLITNLKKSKGQLNTLQEVDTFFESRYMSGLTEQTAYYFFKQLWKFIFKDSSLEAKNNRNINYLCLKVVFNKSCEHIKNQLKYESEYFSSIHIDDYESTEFILDFFHSFPSSYNLFDDAFKLILTKKSEQNINFKLLFWFSSDDKYEYFRSILENLESILNNQTENYPDIFEDPVRLLDRKNLTNCTYEKIINTFKHEAELKSTILKIGIKNYAISRSFDSADVRFNNFISPYLKHYKKNEIIYLISECEGNGQTCGRGRSGSDHMKVLEYAKKLGIVCDTSSYFFQNCLI